MKLRINLIFSGIQQTRQSMIIQIMGIKSALQVSPKIKAQRWSFNGNLRQNLEPFTIRQGLPTCLSLYFSFIAIPKKVEPLNTWKYGGKNIYHILEALFCLCGDPYIAITHSPTYETKADLVGFEGNPVLHIIPGFPYTPSPHLMLCRANPGLINPQCIHRGLSNSDPSNAATPISFEARL